MHLEVMLDTNGLWLLLSSPLIVLSTRAAVETRAESKVGQRTAQSPQYSGRLIVLCPQSIVDVPGRLGYRKARRYTRSIQWLELQPARYCNHKRVCLCIPLIEVLPDLQSPFRVYYYFYERSKGVVLSSRRGHKGLSTLESIITGLVAGTSPEFHFDNVLWLSRLRQDRPQQY